MSDVVAQPIKWLWPGRIARGKVTVIAGHPGLGKSQVTASPSGHGDDRPPLAGRIVLRAGFGANGLRRG